MAMEIMTRNELHRLASKMNLEIIERITQTIYGSVVFHAENSLATRVSWTPKDYIFGNADKITGSHMFVVCTRLKALFPDCKITQPQPLEIVIDWT